MKIKYEKRKSLGIKIKAEENNREIGRAYLYLLKNDLHEEPFGFMEDVFVNKEYRGRGIGKEILNNVIKKAQENNCYKLICTSRYSNEKVHSLYVNLGFKDYGKEFRINL